MHTRYLSGVNNNEETKQKVTLEKRQSSLLALSPLLNFEGRCRALVVIGRYVDDTLLIKIKPNTSNLF